MTSSQPRCPSLGLLFWSGPRAGRPEVEAVARQLHLGGFGPGREERADYYDVVGEGVFPETADGEWDFLRSGREAGEKA